VLQLQHLAPRRKASGGEKKRAFKRFVRSKQGRGVGGSRWQTPCRTRVDNATKGSFCVPAHQQHVPRTEIPNSRGVHARSTSWTRATTLGPCAL